MLWKEIEKILRAVEHDFPGVHLNFFYLCPQCIIEDCGSTQLTSLSANILENYFPFREEKEHYACKKGHSLSANQVKGNNTNLLLSKIQGIFFYSSYSFTYFVQE
jgi:hypothetical protein